MSYHFISNRKTVLEILLTIVLTVLLSLSEHFHEYQQGVHLNNICWWSYNIIFFMFRWWIIWPYFIIVKVHSSDCWWFHQALYSYFITGAQSVSQSVDKINWLPNIPLQIQNFLICQNLMFQLFRFKSLIWDW